MMLQVVFRTSWICFLFFTIGACFPVRKGPIVSQPGYIGGGMGAGSSFSTGSGFGPGSFSGSGSSGSSLDAGIAEMIAVLMQLAPNQPSFQSHWTADQIPLGMMARQEVYPSSHVIHTNSGYQRAQDSHTNSKYTQDDSFNYISVPGVSQDTQGTKS